MIFYKNSARYEAGTAVDRYNFSIVAVMFVEVHEFTLNAEVSKCPALMTSEPDVTINQEAGHRVANLSPHFSLFFPIFPPPLFDVQIISTGAN